MTCTKTLSGIQRFFANKFCVNSDRVPSLAAAVTIGFLVLAANAWGLSDSNDRIEGLDPIADTTNFFGPCYGQATVYFNLEVAGLWVCAASVSITTIDPARVESTGKLWMIAPTVELSPGFFVEHGGRLSVISADLTDHYPNSDDDSSD